MEPEQTAPIRSDIELKLRLCAFEDIRGSDKPKRLPIECASEGAECGILTSTCCLSDYPLKSL